MVKFDFMCRSVRYFFILSLLLSLHFSALAQADCGINILPINLGDTTYVCEGTSLNLEATGGENYSWSPAADFSDPNSAMTSLTPSESQWYYVTGDVADSTCTDSLFVVLFDPEYTFTPETTDSVCQHLGLNVQIEANAPFEIFSVVPPAGFQDLGNGNYLFQPDQSTIYTVTLMVGNCQFEEQLEVPVIPFSVEVMPEDSLYLCLGESGNIDLDVSPNNINLTWSPIDTTITIAPDNESAVVNPTVTTTYTIIAEGPKCSDTIDIVAKVDSLPELTFNLIVEKPFYCEGEIVTIYSEFADPEKYPDIKFQWMPDDGQIQDSLNTENVAIMLRDTTIFQRVTMNGGCIDTMEIKIDVVPALIPLSLTDTLVCPGDQFQVFVLDEDIDDIEWEPADGLSCTDCFDPTVFVLNSPVVYTVTGTKTDMKCPVAATLSVNFKPDFQIPIDPGSAAICPGDEVIFNIDDTGLSNLQLSLDLTGDLSCDDCNTPTVTSPGPNTLIVEADIESDLYCGARGTASVVLNPNDNYTINSVFTCPGEPVVADLNGLNIVNPRISFVTGTGTLSCDDCLTPTITVNAPATVQVISDSSNPNFCNRVGTFDVRFKGTAPQAILEPMPLCAGVAQVVDLNDLGLENPSLSLFGNGTLSCNDCQTPTITISGPDSLYIDSDSPDPDFCFQRTVIPLFTLPDSVISLNSLAVCPGVAEVIDLENLGFSAPVQLSTNVGTLSCTDCLTPTITTSEPAVIQILGSSDNPDYCGITGSLSVFVSPASAATLTFDPDDPGQGDMVTITLELIPELPDGTSYTWFVNGSEINTSTPDLTVQLNERMNMIRVEWTNVNGCEEFAQIDIEADPPELDMPNAFTPNKDNLNDFFRPIVKGNIEITEFVIFNRWGQKVYEGDSPLEGWDGNFNGEISPSDVYVYVISYRFPNGNIDKMKGDVTLLR